MFFVTVHAYCLLSKGPMWQDIMSLCVKSVVIDDYTITKYGWSGGRNVNEIIVASLVIINVDEYTRWYNMCHY